MSAERNELHEALMYYVTDTLIYINTVRRFCEVFPTWILERKSELSMINIIKKRTGSIDRNIKDVTQSEEKGAAFMDYMKSKVTQVTAEVRLELEKELAAVLMDTVMELEKLHIFLDAVEKLAVTSLHVFVEEDQMVLNLPEGVGLDLVQVSIAAARLVCPLLLEFKRDPNVFFLPKLQNVEVLAYQLDRYIETTQLIFGTLKESTVTDFPVKMKMTEETELSLSVEMSEDNVQRMLQHIKQLDDIRMNQDFRLVSLFGDEYCSVFLEEFSDRQPRMLQCLTELEEVAVQLDSMNKGARISSVVGSSVGAIGGVLSIVGLALIPVTAGLSMGLTMTGVGLSATSGVNGLVTTATEIGVNNTQQKKAREVFQQFMEDVQILQGCLEEVSAQSIAKMYKIPIEIAVGVSKMLGNAGFIARGIDSLIDSAGAAKVVAQEGKALGNAPKVAADIPDIGQAALKGPLALSKSARAGLIGLNVFFLGMDVFFICKDSISLSKGSETVVSQFIRARSTLWGSEIDAWKKIYDSLSKGQSTAEKNRIILDTPFYPEPEVEEEEEVDMETPPEEVAENTEEGGTSCVIQ